MNSINSTQLVGTREPAPIWSQFDTVGVEFAYLMETNSQRYESKDKLILDAVDSDNLNLRQWTSFLGIDVTMLELEDQFISLVNNIDKRMFNLVQRTKQEIKSKGQITSSDIETLKENANKNWKWLQVLSETVEKHLKNASDYHVFYQTLFQYKISIPNIGVSERSQMNRKQYFGNYEEANDIYKSIKSHISHYFTWWQKIETLISHSRKLNPLELRIESSDVKIPVEMLTDYQDNNVSFHKGEKVFRYKNDSPQRWIIENIQQDQIKNVPSICTEICPPDINAIEDSLLLRLDLLGNWTTSIKEIGGVLMDYIARILEYWNNPNIDISACRSYKNDRDSISKSLISIETMLDNFWKDSPQLGFLQSRINELKSELELHDKTDVLNEEAHINRNMMFINVSPLVLEKYNDINSNSSLSRSETLTYQKRATTILISKYRELHKNWEMYKNLVEHSSDLSFICNAKENLEASIGDPSRSEQLLNFLSADDQLAWSKYLELLIENKQISGQNVLDKFPVINVTPNKLELVSKQNTYDLNKGSQKSQIYITVPAEREMRFFQNKPIMIHSEDTVTSSIDISHYFTKSLLPTEEQIKEIKTKPTYKFSNQIEKQDFARKFLNSTLQRAKTANSEDLKRVNLQKSKVHINCPMDELDAPFLNKRITDHTKSYLILNLPRQDKIIYIIDRRQQKQLSPTEAQSQGLCDENFLEILDTDTNIRYNFHAAVARGLVTLNSTNISKLTEKSIFSNEENFMKVVYKINEILDPENNNWISLKDAVNQNILNQRSGLLKINKTDFLHIIKAMKTNVRARRINHCNPKSLPPEMTIEIPRIL